MIDLMMLAISLQRLITAKAIGVIDRAFPGLLFDVLHQHRSTDTFDDACVNMAFSLKQPENKALSGSASTSFTFAMASKVSFVQFNLATKATGLKFGHVI